MENPSLLLAAQFRRRPRNELAVQPTRRLHLGILQLDNALAEVGVDHFDAARLETPLPSCAIGSPLLSTDGGSRT